MAHDDHLVEVQIQVSPLNRLDISLDGSSLIGQGERWQASGEVGVFDKPRQHPAPRGEIRLGECFAPEGRRIRYRGRPAGTIV